MPLEARYRSLIPLGVTQDTPERNSQSLYVSGSIAPRLSGTGTKLLLGSFNVCAYEITDSIAERENRCQHRIRPRVAQVVFTTCGLL